MVMKHGWEINIWCSVSDFHSGVLVIVLLFIQIPVIDRLSDRIAPNLRNHILMQLKIVSIFIQTNDENEITFNRLIIILCLKSIIK